MGAMSWWHWVIVLVALVVLFGSKKLPDAARGLGQSLRIFKSEVQEMQKDGQPSSTATPVPSEPTRELPSASNAPADQSSTSDETTKKSA